MGLSVWQIAIVAVLILILFGRGRISEMMGDFGKGISSFKKGLNEDVDAPASSSDTPSQIEGPAGEAKSSTESKSADRNDSAS
ncbi:MAG: twin-arginine translocase TatA/TatE family subunit [Erythrobacter sp.]